MSKKKQGNRKRSELQILTLKAGREKKLASVYGPYIERGEEEEEPLPSSLQSDILARELERKTEVLTETHNLAVQQAIEKRDMEESINMLKTSNLALEKRVVELESELTQRMKQLNAAKLRSTASNKQLRYARMQLRRAHECNETLKGKVGVLGSELLGRQEKLTKSESEVIELQNQVFLHRNALAEANHLHCILRLHLLRYQSHCVELEMRSAKLERQSEKEHRQLGKPNHLRSRIHELEQKCHSLQMSVIRSRKKVGELTEFKNRMQEVTKLTEESFYSPRVRSLVRNIVSNGCPVVRTRSVLLGILNFVCDSMGLEPQPFRVPSVRTIRRIIAEGDIASRLQLGKYLKETKGKLSFYGSKLNSTDLGRRIYNWG